MNKGQLVEHLRNMTDNELEKELEAIANPDFAYEAELFKRWKEARRRIEDLENMRVEEGEYQ